MAQTIALVTPVQGPPDLQQVVNNLILSINTALGSAPIATYTVQATSSAGSLPGSGIVGLSATGGVAYALADIPVGGIVRIINIVSSSSGNGNNITPATTAVIVLSSGSTSAVRTWYLSGPGAAVDFIGVTPTLIAPYGKVGNSNSSVN